MKVIEDKEVAGFISFLCNNWVLNYTTGIQKWIIEK
jgi:hypothetical protein